MDAESALLYYFCCIRCLCLLTLHHFLYQTLHHFHFCHSKHVLLCWPCFPLPTECNVNVSWCNQLGTAHRPAAAPSLPPARVCLAQWRNTGYKLVGVLLCCIVQRRCRKLMLGLVAGGQVRASPTTQGGPPNWDHTWECSPGPGVSVCSYMCSS